MPLYEYECKKCHHHFEKIQKFSDSHMRKCPDCGGRVELVISAPAAHFKGSGFYVTDYPNKSSRPPASSGSSSEGESAKASSKDSSSKESPGDSSSRKDSKPKTESRKADKK